MSITKSQNARVMSEEAIQYLCKCINLVNSLPTSVIDNLHLADNLTFSSTKIDRLLTTLKEDCNKYTDSIIANLSRLELKVVTDEADMIEHNKLYLIKKAGETSYSQYVIVTNDSGVDEKILLGTCDISMTDYLKITDADSTYCKKTDFDTLKTALTTHTGDTNIHVTSDEKTKWNKAITEDQLYGYIQYFPKTIQFGHAVRDTSDAKWVKIFEFTPNNDAWNGGNFIITFSSLNPVNSYYPFGEYELMWKCESSSTDITDVCLNKIISQNDDVCHTRGSALCVGISENKKTVGLYAFLGISSYQTMLATIISGGSRYENNQSEIGKWINIDKPTVGLEEQPTFSKAMYYSLADNLGGWTYTATKLPVLNYTNVE